MEKKQKSNTGVMALIGVGALMVLGAMSAGLWFLLKKKEKKEDEIVDKTPKEMPCTGGSSNFYMKFITTTGVAKGVPVVFNNDTVHKVITIVFKAGTEFTFKDLINEAGNAYVYWDIPACIAPIDGPDSYITDKVIAPGLTDGNRVFLMVLGDTGAEDFLLHKLNIFFTGPDSVVFAPFIKVKDTDTFKFVKDCAIYWHYGEK